MKRGSEAAFRIVGARRSGSLRAGCFTIDPVVFYDGCVDVVSDCH